MLTITFYPDSDEDALIQASEDYQNIWDNEGEDIVSKIAEISNLKFIEKYINAVVFEGMSFSHPLSLRASYTAETKKATLIHELCHRLTFGNNLKHPTDNENLQLTIHKKINLILYDIWVELYGEKFADEQVEIESKRQPFYKEAWNWALKYSKSERAENFSKLKA